MHLTEGTPPVYAEIGRGVGKAGELPKAVSGQTISAWSWRDEAPDGRRNTSGLAKYLNVTEEWLIDGEGEPPRPDLWSVWSTARDVQRNAALEMARPTLAIAKSPGKKRKRSK
jgi:hypothetical protein